MNEVTHEEIARRVEQLEKMMLANTTTTVSTNDEVTRLREDMTKTLELVEAYAAVKTGGKFVAWFAKFLAGLLALWVFMKGSAQLLVELGRNGNG